MPKIQRRRGQADESAYTLAFPAVIRKDQIAVAARFEGKVNATPLELNGAAPGTIRYVTFAGALDINDGLYKGEFRFLPATPGEEAEAADLNQLPGAEETPVMDGQSAEEGGDQQ